MSAITTHVLDVAQGRPAVGVPVLLEAHPIGGTWTPMASGMTDADGRVQGLLEPHAAVAPGRYRLTFDTAAYFLGQGIDAFFPEVRVVFEVRDSSRPYHVPLLLSPFGYSTYRGS
jgi:5-hydroxyisourate hydrolase